MACEMTSADGKKRRQSASTAARPATTPVTVLTRARVKVVKVRGAREKELEDRDNQDRAGPAEDLTFNETVLRQQEVEAKDHHRLHGVLGDQAPSLVLPQSSGGRGCPNPKVRARVRANSAK